MPKERQATEAGEMSTVDIAATLLRGQQPVVADDDADLDPDLDQETEDHDDTAEADAPDEDEEQSPTGGEDDEGDELETSDEDESNDESDETDYLDIRDDDLIAVTVDGEEQEVSIGDLKRAFSGEGAIEKRLQEATEARNAVMEQHSVYTQQLEKLADRERVVITALQGLDNNLFKEVIPAPPENLRTTNPEQYLRHKEAYDNDQKRINEARETLEGAIAAVQKDRAERLQQYATEASKVIAREIPELMDQKTAKPMYDRMAATAKAYGYTQQEIDAAMDPRMFMLVRDAMRYRELKDKTKETDPTDLSKQERKRVRRLRSGNTGNKTRVRQADKQRQTAVKRARETGKVNDVAATLLTPKG